MKRSLARLGSALNMSMDKYIPDCFLFAVGLTFIIFIMGMTIAGKGLFQMIEYWYNGFWGFLAFSMQMVLIIVTGYTLAVTPIGNKIFTWLATIPKSSLPAVVFIGVVVSVLSWLHWGLGIVAGAILAPKMGRNIPRINYKMLVASAYVGWCSGAYGLTVTETLIVNTPGHFMQKQIGLIPISQTSFHIEILVPVILCTFVIVPALWWLFHPEEDEIPPLDAAVVAAFEQEIAEEKAKMEGELTCKPDTADSSTGLATGINVAAKKEKTIASRIEDSRIICYLTSALALSYVVYWFATKGFDLNLNIFNFAMLFIGFALHGTPRRFYTAFAEGTKLSWGVVLQFPFYAGIQGMMGASGLVAIISGWFVAISTPLTFPLWTFVSASIVNFFIPSAGGILMVQGPIMMNAAQVLGVPYADTIRAFTAGENIANIIQPFFAIPLLALARLEMKDIMGYCIIAWIVTSIAFMVSIWVF